MQNMGTWFALSFLLMACGGGGTSSGGGGGGGSSGAGIDPRLARLDIYEAQKLRVLGDPGAGVVGMPVAMPEDVPQMGTMTFDGGVTIRVEDGTTPLVLFGDARVTVDFDLGAATGNLGNFLGNTSTGAVVDYGGTIALDSASAAQDLIFTYAGSLAAQDEALAFDGQMQGTFLGQPVGALVGADLEATVDHNGQPKAATLVLITEQSVTP